MYSSVNGLRAAFMLMVFQQQNIDRILTGLKVVYGMDHLIR